MGRSEIGDRSMGGERGSVGMGKGGPQTDPDGVSPPGHRARAHTDTTAVPSLFVGTPRTRRGLWVGLQPRSPLQAQGCVYPTRAEITAQLCCPTAPRAQSWGHSEGAGPSLAGGRGTGAQGARRMSACGGCHHHPPLHFSGSSAASLVLH